MPFKNFHKINIQKVKEITEAHKKNATPFLIHCLTLKDKNIVKFAALKLIEILNIPHLRRLTDFTKQKFLSDIAKHSLRILLEDFSYERIIPFVSPEYRPIFAKFLKSKKIIRSLYNKDLFAEFFSRILFMPKEQKQLLISFAQNVKPEHFRSKIEPIIVALNYGFTLDGIKNPHEILPHLQRAVEKKYKIKIPFGLDSKLGKAVFLFSLNHNKHYGFGTFRRAVEKFMEGKFKEWKFEDLQLPDQLRKKWIADYKATISATSNIEFFLKAYNILLENVFEDTTIKSILSGRLSQKEIAKKLKTKDINKIADGIRKIVGLSREIKMIVESEHVQKKFLAFSFHGMRRSVLNNINRLEKALRNVGCKHLIKFCKKARALAEKKPIEKLTIETTSNFEDLLFTGMSPAFESCLSYDRKGISTSGLIGIIALPFIKNIVARDTKGNIVGRITIGLAYVENKPALLILSHYNGMGGYFLGAGGLETLLVQHLKKYAKQLGIPLFKPSYVITYLLQNKLKFPKTMKKCSLYSDFFAKEDCLKRF